MQAFKDLLANLNSDDINFFPCYCDNISQITFRIGSLNNGPLIHFLPVNQNNFDCTIRNIDGQVLTFPLVINSEEFNICNQINQKVRQLILDYNYQNRLSNEETMSAYLGNLVRIINPIFIR
jgi:hypothetical protein